ncbi:MAG: uroporphyrinogen decarboxylase family protein [Candidatus Brocadiaceae bacterium]|jgi:uroporphyrinogen decarboxylase
MMTARECYNRVLRFLPAEYVPNFEFGPMDPGMLEEWREQGMPEDTGFADYFDLHPLEDFMHVRFDPIPGVPDQGVVSEDDQRKVVRDGWGRVVEHRKRADIATGARRVIRWAVSGREDWERIRGHFRPDEPLRYPDHWDEDDWEQKKARWNGRSYPLQIRGPSMLGRIKEVMGFEDFCVMLYEDRALVEEILETRTQLALDILGRAFEEVDFDVFHFWEDIAYNSGPMLSPALFEELAVPRYRRLTDFYRSRGGEICSVDSDGDISELIPLWMAGGINHVWPLEVNAGMDVVALRAEYGHDLSLRGGVNKFVLLDGPEAIDRELDRVAPVVRDGGYIPQLDHQIPAGVRFEDFCYYMERKRELLGIRS